LIKENSSRTFDSRRCCWIWAWNHCDRTIWCIGLFARPYAWRRPDGSRYNLL